MVMPVMVGPFPLTPAGVSLDEVLAAPATYCLGTIGADGGFMPGYVGRVEDGLAAHLQTFIGSERYDVFMYTLAMSPHDAFMTECDIYHRFKPRDNTTHPLRLPNAGWACPICGKF